MDILRLRGRCHCVICVIFQAFLLDCGASFTGLTSDRHLPRMNTTAVVDFALAAATGCGSQLDKQEAMFGRPTSRDFAAFLLSNTPLDSIQPSSFDLNAILRDPVAYTAFKAFGVHVCGAGPMFAVLEDVDYLPSVMKAVSEPTIDWMEQTVFSAMRSDVGFAARAGTTTARTSSKNVEEGFFSHFKAYSVSQSLRIEAAIAREANDAAELCPPICHVSLAVASSALTYITQHVLPAFNASPASLRCAALLEARDKQVEAGSSLTHDDFAWLGRIGRGGYGSVFVVARKASGRLYAAKVLDKRRIKNKNAARLAQLERQAMAAVVSPFVSGLSFAYNCGNEAVLVSELSTGRDLEWHVRDARRLAAVRDARLWTQARVELNRRLQSAFTGPCPALDFIGFTREEEGPDGPGGAAFGDENPPQRKSRREDQDGEEAGPRMLASGVTTTGIGRARPFPAPGALGRAYSTDSVAVSSQQNGVKQGQVASDNKVHLRSMPSRALPESVAKRVLAEVALGIAAMHACGIVHRDVKPANILIDEDGRAVLSDLGLAAFVGNSRLRAEALLALAQYDELRAKCDAVQMVDASRETAQPALPAPAAGAAGMLTGADDTAMTPNRIDQGVQALTTQLRDVGLASPSRAPAPLDANVAHRTGDGSANLSVGPGPRDRVSTASSRSRFVPARFDSNRLVPLEDWPSILDLYGQDDYPVRKPEFRSALLPGPSKAPSPLGQPAVQALLMPTEPAPSPSLLRQCIPGIDINHLCYMVRPHVRGKAGTPGFWAPEMLQHDQNGKPAPYDAAVDWWSFGCLMYSVMAGRGPFNSFCGDTADDNNATLGQSPLTKPDPDYDDRVFSPEAADLCARLLRRDPRKRAGCGDDGAAEILSHPFFSGVDIRALIRGMSDTLSGGGNTGEATGSSLRRVFVTANTHLCGPTDPSRDDVNDLESVKLDPAEEHTYSKAFFHCSKAAVDREIIEAEVMRAQQARDAALSYADGGVLVSGSHPEDAHVQSTALKEVQTLITRRRTPLSGPGPILSPVQVRTKLSMVLEGVSGPYVSTWRSMEPEPRDPDAYLRQAQVACERRCQGVVSVLGDTFSVLLRQMISGGPDSVAHSLPVQLQQMIISTISRNKIDPQWPLLLGKGEVYAGLELDVAPRSMLGDARSLLSVDDGYPAQGSGRLSALAPGSTVSASSLKDGTPVGGAFSVHSSVSNGKGTLDEEAKMESDIPGAPHSAFPFNHAPETQAVKRRMVSKGTLGNKPQPESAQTGFGGSPFAASTAPFFFGAQAAFPSLTSDGQAMLSAPAAAGAAAANVAIAGSQWKMPGSAQNMQAGFPAGGFNTAPAGAASFPAFPAYPFQSFPGVGQSAASIGSTPSPYQSAALSGTTDTITVLKRTRAQVRKDGILPGIASSFPAVSSSGHLAHTPGASVDIMVDTPVTGAVPGRSGGRREQQPDDGKYDGEDDSGDDCEQEGKDGGR